MHPRACVSAISTFNLALDEDLAFWERHDIDTSACRSRSSSGSAGTRAPSSWPTRSRAGSRREPHRPRSVHPRRPGEWPKQQDRLVRSHRHRGRARRRVHGVHDRPVRAADVGRRPPTISKPRSPRCCRRAKALRHAVRDRAHELAAGRRRLRAHPARRRRPRAPVRRRRVHGAQRVLGRARAPAARSATASIASVSCR